MMYLKADFMHFNACIYGFRNDCYADGIVRDPIGISDLESCTFEEIVAKYTRPSGVELVAKVIVTSFSNSSGTSEDRLLECNKAVKELNNKYNKDCDYLENDYYGAVVS